MKKGLCILAVITLALLLLIGCKDDHEHVFGDWTETVAATCVANGTRQRSCECGKIETADIPATGIHVYNNENKCNVCGKDYVFTAGLQYTMNADGASYAVSGIGTATDSTVILPPYYKGLPVTMLQALSSVAVRGIHLPSTVTSVSPGALNGCNELETIEVDGANTALKSTGNCLIAIAQKRLIAGGKGATIPADGSVEIIGASAFAGRSGLVSVTIPADVSVIEPGAFAGCGALETVTFAGKPGFDNTSADANDPNGLYVGEWIVYADANSSVGTKIDVETDAANAANLKSTYAQSYWRRSIESDDSMRY